MQRVGFALVGPAQRLLEHLDSAPGQYTDADVSPYFWHNGVYPTSAGYTALRDGDFADYRLQVNGFVENPVEQMFYRLTMLAYDVNGEPLSFGHGAHCGCATRYNEDHEFFGYRQSI